MKNNDDKRKNNTEIQGFNRKTPKCSFCGRSADKVDKIIQGMHNS